VPPGFPDHVARVFGNFKLRHSSYVYCLAYSPDGKRLASASQDGTVKVWDSATGRELLTFGGHADRVNAVAFSPDGKLLASAGGDRIARLWDADSGAAKLAQQVHTTSVYQIVFSPDSQAFATCGADSVAKLHDLTGTEKQAFKGHAQPVTSVAFSKD